MKRIEIKQRKKMVVPFLLLGISVLLITSYGIFFTEYGNDTTKKIGFFVGLAVFGYFAYSAIRKLVKNQPVIVLDRHSIMLHTNTEVTIPKSEIENIQVTYLEETGYFLNIKTKNTTYETNISWLDKTPDEIKELIKDYKES
jgi:hypothetical protein